MQQENQSGKAEKGLSFAYQARIIILCLCRVADTKIPTEK